MEFVADEMDVRTVAVAFVVKSMGDYRTGVRGNIRALWSGFLDVFGFYASMSAVIRRGFTQAWLEGAAKHGIKPEDLTEAEIIRLNEEIGKEMGFISGLADAVDQGSKKNGGKLTPLLQRAESWARSYTRIVNLAAVYAGKDKPKRWTLNPAEHCNSCLRLDGKVKRASYWREHGVYPKSWAVLQCRNDCKCTLEDTTEPISRGPLPALP